MNIRWLKDPPPIVQWAGCLSSLFGVPILTAFAWFKNLPVGGWIICGIAIVLIINLASSISLIQNNKALSQERDNVLEAKHNTEQQCKAKLAKKDEEIKRCKAELTQKDSVLKYYDAKLKEQIAKTSELEEEVSRWKRVHDAEIPMQAGNYMTNKAKYENFKTRLILSRCNLDVSLVKTSDSAEPRLRFKWTLHVSNVTSPPVKEAHFIYSGDQEDTTIPAVTVNGEAVHPVFRPGKDTTGDDRFMIIPLSDPLERGGTATIHISYILPKYRFNPECDMIWLVPDALGFADMQEFRIRFFKDGKIINNKTECVLRSYQLEGNYPVQDDELIELEKIWNGEEGFVCKKNKKNTKLEGRGFLLILINNRDAFPPHLQKIPPPKNTKEQS